MGNWKMGGRGEPGYLLSLSLGFGWHLLQWQHLLLASVRDPPSVVLDASRQLSLHSSSRQPALSSGIWGTPVSPLGPSAVAAPCYCYTIPGSGSSAFLSPV